MQPETGMCSLNRKISLSTESFALYVPLLAWQKLLTVGKAYYKGNLVKSKICTLMEDACICTAFLES